MNPIRNERMRTVGRFFIYLVLVIFLVRNLVDIVQQFTGSNQPVVQQQAATSLDVPDNAKSVAKLFVEKWYFIRPDQDDAKRLENLQPLVTVSLYEYINSNKDLSIDNSQNSTLPSSTGKATTTDQAGGQNTTFQGVSAQEVDVWRATWKDQKTGKAQIVLRLLASDGKILFLSLPVEKSGSTWQVSSLPSLIAEPKGSGKIDEASGIDISDKKDAIQTVLESFFTDWLGGNQEAITRYMANGKPIPTTNWLEKLNAKFEGVQSITAVSENPLKVKVVIMLKDSNNMTMLLDYYMTLEQKNGSWNIDSID